MRKIYLHLAGGVSVLGLVAQPAPAAAADLSQLVAANPEPITSVEIAPVSPAPEVVSATTTATPEAAPATPALVAQAAQPVPTAPVAPAPVAQPQQSTPSVSQLVGNQSMNQVTSVSQLSDVRPTDWAFQALQSLVERYGVIAGYPDGTYRGNRAMTRYEFAAGLNAALDRVNELIAAGLADKVSREDLATLQRLQEEFAAELATLRGRVDSLEARTAELEANQFSTTTKLAGEVIFAINGGAQRARGGTDADPNVTFLARARLNFDTSFTGDDLLRTRLQGRTAADGPDDAAEFFGAIGSGLDYSGGSNGNNITLAKLFYAFPIGEDIDVTIGATGTSLTDYMDFGTYANNSSVDFQTFALVNNFVLFAGDPGSASAAVAWNPGKGPFTLTAAYTAVNAANANPKPGGLGTDDRDGLFGDPYLGGAELSFIPGDLFAIRLQYVGGAISGERHSAVGASFEFTPFKGISFFGRYGYAFDFADGAAGVSGGLAGDDIGDGANPQYAQVGVAFPNLFVEGALAGISAAYPFIEDTIGDVTQLNFEAFYNFPISDKISITPALQVINNSGNDSSQGTVYTGTLRTVFKF